ncbi:hypothetical protein MTR67_021573 [Solanum verrucosum]|uniref:Retrotransposon gag domain-containing protein n=1 Tax=Solanum verrucosum TaxID=315347 RepID=A0AAF0QTQ5_SOLVR|nr:hypothetical protein MTR67_021573 [Solanum verrucosum]
MTIARQDNPSATPTLRHRTAAMEFGRFRGEHPNAWIFQAERYFDFYRIEDSQKLTMKSFYLDGDAIEWYRWLFRNKQLIGWEHFAEKARVRFKPKGLESAEGVLAKLRQVTTISELHSRFDAIVNETNDILDGLMAHIHECRIQAEKGTNQPTFANKGAPLLPSPNQHSSTSFITSPTKTMTSASNLPPLKRLNYCEIQSRQGSDVQPDVPEPFISDDLLVEELQVLEVQEQSVVSYHDLAGRSNQVADALSRPSDIVLLAISSRNYELENELKYLNQSHPELLDIHKKLEGRSNQVADALSRPSDIVLLAISSRNYELENELKYLNQSHPELLDIHKKLEGQSATYLGYVFRDSLLFFRG